MTATATSEETLTIPLAGVPQARVRLAFGGGELTLHRAEPGMLVSGTFEGGVKHRSRGPGSIELEPRTPAAPFLGWRPIRWEVGLTAEIPVELRLDTGANRSKVDLRSLRIRRLEIHTGASETTVRLPAAGQTSVLVSCGLASVTLEVAEGVAARIRGQVALGALVVDERRFPRDVEGWSSPGFETAPARVEISVEGGLGSVHIA